MATTNTAKITSATSTPEEEAEGAKIRMTADATAEIINLRTGAGRAADMETLEDTWAATKLPWVAATQTCSRTMGAEGTCRGAAPSAALVESPHRSSHWPA
eukprot:Gregarina_sp_Pseudo_9__4010@NODE_4150_length_477_cov_337_490868_g3821_i0_p2_GENE_NODE_4150_length_477_cov_337_490868_g3821_i0NODE_4150_length_477_cov_337_490868_g3821_i0_p2_ORF_typecomplete_len101_score3_56Transp_inhibit/PF18791_1/0_17_NODE_4150_length_477_cov_337_490868_g3821_i06308